MYWRAALLYQAELNGPRACARRMCVEAELMETRVWAHRRASDLPGFYVTGGRMAALPKLVDKEDYAPLPREQLVHIHDLMVKSRALEERLIQMYKKGDGYFWIGGPG